jgi:hypothetical protein
LFVCARGAPIIDFFIHDANAVKVFLEVSQVAYQHHKGKYDPKLNVYFAATLNPVNKAQIQYVNLTTNNDLMKQNKL